MFISITFLITLTSFVLYVPARLDWLADIMFSGCPFVRSSVTCEQNISKTNEPILMQIGMSGPRNKVMKWSTLGSEGRR